MFVNSPVFDPEGENHEAYKEIHNKYKEMVGKSFFTEPSSRFIRNVEASNF